MKQKFPLFSLKRAFAALIAATSLTGPVWAQDVAEIAAQLEAMKQQIAALEARLAEAEAKAAAAPETSSAAPESADWTGSPSEESGGKGVVGDAIGEEGWWDRTSLGGYGEMHLNLGDKEQLDYHRWVLFINHDFNDRIRLFNELELEHSLAGDGKPGEVELEQAYLEFELGNDFWLKTGLYLIPVGLLNETHEPNTFYGVERNIVEAEIIPTTWWEGGAMLSKNFDSGFGIDLAGHSGLNAPADGDNAFRLRSGRQKVAEALADEGAGTLRLRYNGIPGLALAGSAQYQSDLTQETAENNDAWFYTAHGDFRRGPFGLRALGGYWEIDGPSPAALGLSQQWGYYVEPSWRFSTAFGEFGVFGRWGEIDSEKGENQIIDAGINYWPIPNIVFKADWRKFSGDSDEETINAGVGFAF